MKIAITGDASKTIFSNRFGEHYHSVYGAVNESTHVFVNAGYLAVSVLAVSILEVGFGTGLNAWLTMKKAESLNRKTLYETVELYPVDYATVCELSEEKSFLELHTAQWEQSVEITPTFSLLKRNVDFLTTSFERSFDVVYFDAFSPAVQPEMWSETVFRRLYEAMNSNAVLTTYCAKGEVRRTMQKAGFITERLPGPTGKREMLRAKKIL